MPYGKSGHYRIEEQLDDLLLPVKIDLSILDQIDNPQLINHIERVGKLIYRKPSPESNLK